jgi:hypothetical protein
MKDLVLGERVGDLEERVTLLAQALEQLSPILARINGELIRNGVLGQREGLANQDGLGAVARTAADARIQAMPRRPLAVAAENGSLT